MAYLVFICAFLIRLAYIIQIKSTIFYNNFMLDEAFYNQWALSIAGGDWLGDGVFNALPLYPYILAVIYKIFGCNLFIGRFAEITIGSLSCIVLYLLGKELFGKRAGIIAALIGAFYAPFIFYSGIFAPTVFVIFLYLTALLLLYKAIKTERGISFFIFGLIAGLAGITRAGMLLFIPAVLLWLIITSKAKRKALVNAFAATAGVLLIISPVVLRNYIISDTVSLTSHTGINLYIGNNEEADGRFKPPKWARSNISGLYTDAKTIAEREQGRSLRDSEISGYYTSRAVGFIKQRPYDFLRLLWRKFMLFINKQELYDIADYSAYREKVPLLKFPFLGFVLIGPIGIAGMIIAAGDWKRLMPMYLFTALYTISILLFFVNSRYRIPFAAVLMLFCGFFISWLIAKIRERSLFKAAAGLALCAVIFPAVNIPLDIAAEATGYNNLGNLYLKAGDYDNAIAAFKEAIEFNPNIPKPYNDAGYAYMMAGDLKKAREYISLSLSANREYPFAHINMGILYTKEGNFRSAAKEYKTAIALNPNIPQAHNNLAGLYERSGERKLAIQEYRKAIELEPEDATAHYNLGVVYGRSGMLKEAKAEFLESLRIEPDSAASRKALEYCQ